ncbi:MAG: UDP-N-acetylmuramate:L-alanyl-gamma-D-glutamyl-meso-diaminopimelate ligase [Deltaproteobacteria bacterium]|nr:UDP-N-acetylmuramate:L-alanyl-gamma-D-glutamyl-meso-diaminopimelate ligase [Deltaproteobacteria bacterium]
MNTERFFPLQPALNMIPPNPKRIHLMGICGTGMASLAGMLKHQDFSISGSDANVYPPMSDFLASLSIPVSEGYSPQNLHANPDLVVVGNVISRQNPETVELAAKGIPYISMPQALQHFAMKGKKPIVIAGTHGKTTTSSLASWVLESAGMDPGFMIGGIPKNFDQNFKLGHGPYFIIEGDEYDTAFFDKGPKFLHYAPWITILTSIEFDHADIFRDLNHVIHVFHQLIDLIPPDGLLIANGDDPIIKEESRRARCRVVMYGFRSGLDWQPSHISFHDARTHMTSLYQNKEYVPISTPLYGEHNISNLLSIVALSEYLKIPLPTLYKALDNFHGVKRRQEILGEKRGILVMDDFAHHPTAVEKTISAVKQRYDSRRLIAVFEPRSNSSRRNIFQEKYGTAFDHADIVMIPEPPMMDKIDPKERFSSTKLVDDLISRGIKAMYFPDTSRLLNELLDQGQEGDIILIMSNGSFDHLHQRLLEKL